MMWVHHLSVVYPHEGVNYMDWSKYYISVNRANELFIGIGKLRKDGVIRFTQRSDDRTFEMVNAVGRMMRNELNKREGKEKKHYFGYEIPNCGKLVLIKPGYEFDVRKKRKSDITRPIQDY